MFQVKANFLLRFIAFKREYNMDDQNKVDLLVTSDKLIVDFDKICRFCLCKTESGISINDKCLSAESKDLEEHSIYSFVMKWRFIKEENSQKFPAQVCHSCYDLIKLCYLFSQLCHRSDTLLRDCLKNSLRNTKETKIKIFKGKTHLLDCDTEINEKLSTIKDLHQLNSPKIFEAYNQKLNLLFGKSKETQLGISNPILEGWQYGCSHCSQKFKDSKALDSHLMAIHYRKRFMFQCQNCTKSFSDDKKLERHLKIFHKINKPELTNNEVKVQGKKNNFFCLYCTPCKEFECQEQLVEHLNMSHHLQCSHCSDLFPTSLSLNQHLSLVHNQEVFLCVKPTTLSNVDTQRETSFEKQEKCFILLSKDCNPPKTFTSKNDFISHMETHGDGSKPSENSPIVKKPKNRRWICSTCEASYSRKESLCHHMKEKHNQTSLGGVKCPEPNCTESFATNRQLLQHGISVHQKYFADFHKVFRKILQPSSEEFRKDKKFECDTCQRKYIYKSSLRKHILATHLGMSEKNTVVCSYCKKTISNKLNLKSHIELVHEALFVYCPICKKKINFRTIGKHYKTHQTTTDMIYSGNIFLCSHCGRILKSKRSFEDHQTLHKNIRNELCNICGSGFTTKKFLRLHKRIHEGPQRKVFSCDQCDKVFNGRHTLNRHVLTHSGKKNFICEICSKCFYTLPELKRHVRYHKKEYRFDCQMCDKRFFDKSRFRHHMMKHRNVRPHKCQFCEKMFIVRGKMNLHMASKHNVEVKSAKKVWKDPDTYVSLDDLL